MEFKENVNVFTSDNKEVGKLKRVVVDPETQEVTHIVIQKGLIFTDDRVVSVNMVRSSSVDRVVLKHTSNEVDKLAPLTVRKELQVGGPPDHEVEYNPYMNTVTDQTVIPVNRRTIPENLVALKEGARVISADGVHVGNVERVFTDSETGRINRFVVSQGLLPKTRKLIPAYWVDLFDDDKVLLSADEYQLEEAEEFKT